jgi:hypothetical protein
MKILLLDIDGVALRVPRGGRYSYTDGHGTAESVASAATAAVAKAPTVSSVVATGTGIRRQGRYHGGKGYSGRHR